MSLLGFIIIRVLNMCITLIYALRLIHTEIIIIVDNMLFNDSYRNWLNLIHLGTLSDIIGMFQPSN